MQKPIAALSGEFGNNLMCHPVHKLEFIKPKEFERQCKAMYRELQKRPFLGCVIATQARTRDNST